MNEFNERYVTKPLVSIITVAYNSVDDLKRSLPLLMAQDYPNIESIIIDGGSVDGSLDYISEFANKFERSAEDNVRKCKWISEKDDGIYSAINKGIGMASGEIIGCYWDMYSSEHVISDIVKVICDEKTDGAHGDLLYVDDEGRTVRKWKVGQGTIRTGWLPGHPTMYLKRYVYETYGVYDTDYRIASDYEFMVRCLKDGNVHLSYIPKVLIRMPYGGTSNNSIGAYWKSTSESYRALKKNRVKPALWIVFLRILRTLLQFRL